jgi:hypothetical protein
MQKKMGCIMKSISICITSGIVVLIIALNPFIARCELNSLDDAELSKVEAEGVTDGDVNKRSSPDANTGVLSVAVDNSDPFDLNNPNRETNTFKPSAVNNNPVAAPQGQFNNLVPSSNCCTSGAPMPGCH